MSPLQPETVDLLNKILGREDVRVESLREALNGATEALVRAENEARLIIELHDRVQRSPDRDTVGVIGHLHGLQGAAQMVLRKADQARSCLRELVTAIGTIDRKQDRLLEALKKVADEGEVTEIIRRNEGANP